MGSKATFWLTVALVVAAIVLPFGSLLLVAAAAARKRRNALTNGSQDPYAAWFRVRDELAGRRN